MVQLKNRQSQIPWGLKFNELTPITGWRPRPGSSFEQIVRGAMGQAAGNPGVAKQHNWPTTYEGWAEWVDRVNAEMCLKNGWHQYIIGGDAGGSAPVPLRQSRPPSGGSGLVATARQVGAGVRLVADWLGDDLVPVHIELAEKRATVCAVCPQNGDPNLLERLTGKAAEELRQLIEVKQGMELKTSQDDKLETCKPCGCYLKLKVWAQLDHVLKHTAPELMAKLDPFCWILRKDQ